MKLVADENIPLLSRFFGEFGNLTQMPGREIKPRDLTNADILIVRSVTNVDRDLLEGSSVKFVGSSTIGMDHIDTEYLNQQGIKYTNAPGSNANSVVEYVLSCLSTLTETHALHWSQLCVGIVGYGNVGSLLGARLKNLGIQFKVFDPFISPCGEPAEFCSFEEVMACDVVTLHVPLTKSANHPTYHMIDEQVLSQMKPAQVLINSSRGSVVNGDHLNTYLKDNGDFTAILDVWENEPEIDIELAKRVFISTPHIAGYSYDGKVKGTEMIYRDLCQFLGLPARYSSGQFLEEPPLSRMAFTSTADVDWSIHTAIRACFDVRHDHSLLKASFDLPTPQRRQAFDLLRKQYRCRREFSGTRIQLKQIDTELHSKFKALGFNVKA